MESQLNLKPMLDSDGNAIYPNIDDDLVFVGVVTNEVGDTLDIIDKYLEFSFKTSTREIFTCILNETPTFEADVHSKNARLDADGQTVTLSIPSNTFSTGGSLYTRIASRTENTDFDDNFQHSYSNWKKSDILIID